MPDALRVAVVQNPVGDWQVSCNGQRLVCILKYTYGLGKTFMDRPRALIDILEHIDYEHPGMVAVLAITAACEPQDKFYNRYRPRHCN